MFATLLLPTPLSSTSNYRPPPRLLVRLTSRWEIQTLVLAIIAGIFSLTSTILYNMSTVADVCNGYPHNATTHCPFSVSQSADRCLLGTSIRPSIRSYYFVPSYTSHCHMTMLVGIITMLHCLILILVAGSCLLNERSFFASQYHLGQILTVLTGLFWFLNLCTAGVASDGYRILCRSLALPICSDPRQFDPYALNCAERQQNLVSCDRLPIWSTIGRLWAGVIVGWLLVAVFTLIALLSSAALYIACWERQEKERQEDRQLQLNNDRASTSAAVPIPTQPPPKQVFPQHQLRQVKPTNLETYPVPAPDAEPTPPSSLARRVEEKYRLPSALPDQMAYQPVHDPPPLMQIDQSSSGATVTASTDV